MTRLYHNPLFDPIREYFEHASPDETIFLFVPYVKTDVLERLISGLKNRIVIVTTWNPMDILSGSSDLKLYPFCKEHGISLYVHEHIHLKAYSVGLGSIMLATGNLSHRGLLPGGNYEAATLLETLTNADRLFFERIRREAMLVDDAMYKELKNWIGDNDVQMPEQIPLSSIISESQDDFLISALPMTKNFDHLVSGYIRINMNLPPSDDPEITSCIFHDLANYGTSPGLSEKEFVKVIAESFFAHPFIKRIDEFISPEAYFGRIKEWVQNNCTDVPVPSRRELTGNVQVLLQWFVILGDGRYVVDRPRHSERIRKMR